MGKTMPFGRSSQNQTASQGEEPKKPRRPYDSSEIQRLPYPTEADPPYKSWWLDPQDEDKH